MVGVVCSEHKSIVSELIEQRREHGAIPNGKIKFQEIKMVTTNCMKTYWSLLSQCRLLRALFLWQLSISY